MRAREHRAIVRYNKLKEAYPEYLSDDVILPLVFESSAPDFDKAVRAFRKRWKAENESDQKKRVKRRK